MGAVRRQLPRKMAINEPRLCDAPRLVFGASSLHLFAGWRVNLQEVGPNPLCVVKCGGSLFPLNQSNIVLYFALLVFKLDWISLLDIFVHSFQGSKNHMKSS